MSEAKDPAAWAHVDPTANVLKLVEEATRRQDDLRANDQTWRNRLDAQTEKWRDKLDAERIRADGLALRAESNRLDALLLANTSNVALALGKQEGQAQAQDRRIAVLEQNQYQAGGKDIQRVESRQSSQFTYSQLIAGAGVLVLVLIELHRSGVI